MFSDNYTVLFDAFIQCLAVYNVIQMEIGK